MFTCKGKFGKAVEAYRESIRLDPIAPETYFNMGTALNDLGKFDEAIDAFRGAAELQRLA